MIYLRCWRSKDGNTVCWGATAQYDYRQHSVRHWTFGNIVCWQHFTDVEIVEKEAEKIADWHKSGSYEFHKVNLDFWEGHTKWKPKRRK